MSGSATIRAPHAVMSRRRSPPGQQIDGKHWSVVVTYRGDRVRIISAHRSRQEEVVLYEG